MQMLKGETIKIYVKTSTGTDDFGQPVYTEIEESVDNVLIGSPSSDDVITENTISGKHIVYVLGIPKDDAHAWENSIVLIRDRKYRTVGIPTEYTVGNMPTWWAWPKQIKVEHYE